MTHKTLKVIIFGMTRGDGELLFEWLRARIWSKKKSSLQPHPCFLASPLPAKKPDAQANTE